MPADPPDTPRAWFELAFGAHYLDFYPRRRPEQAALEAAFACETLGLGRGERVLDLGCGPGFHLEALAARGLRPVGVDLSPSLLALAHTRGFAARGDLRAPPHAGPFAAVLSFFTTFGYFEEAENRLVLAEMARLLEPGGRFLLDYLNADALRRGLVPCSEKLLPSGLLRETRLIAGEPPRVLKEVEWLPTGQGEPLRYTESVRLYSVPELEALLSEAGLELRALHGDFDGSPAGPDAPRAILSGVKLRPAAQPPWPRPGPRFRQVAAGGDRNFSYLLAEDGEAAAIDPLDPRPLALLAQTWNVRISWILATHGHPDHCAGIEALRAETGARVAAHAAAALPKDLALRGGERLPLGGNALHILATPGHTPDSICILWRERLLTGDTLFVGKVGGTDLHSGARAEHESLFGTIARLDPRTEVWPGHDYGLAPSSSVGRELATNPFLLRPDFAAFLDLKANWAEYKRLHGIA